MRLTRKRMADQFKKEHAAIRVQVEMDLYPQVIEDWTSTHPVEV